MIKRILRLLAICSLPIISSTNVTNAANTAHMQLAGLTSQPIGHYNYCKQYVADCKIKSLSGKSAKLTRKRWNDLVEINAYSNSTIAPVTDLEGFGVEELWLYPESIGDCEDYVLMKRHMLMQRGWPASALLITVVLLPNGDGHAVLTVRTERADYVLDNLSETVKQWDQTEYTYLKRQSAHHSGQWTTILDKRSIPKS